MNHADLCILYVFFYVGRLPSTIILEVASRGQFSEYLKGVTYHLSQTMVLPSTKLKIANKAQNWDLSTPIDRQ